MLKMKYKIICTFKKVINGWRKCSHSIKVWKNSSFYHLINYCCSTWKLSRFKDSIFLIISKGICNILFIDCLVLFLCTRYYYVLLLWPMPIDHLHPLLQLVDVLNGKATIFVTMKTTMQDVSGMVEIVVVAMWTLNSAQFVNV